MTERRVSDSHALAAQAAPASRDTRIAFTVLLLGAVAIGFSPIFVRLSEVGPTATAFWRVGLAVPVLWLWMSVDRRQASARVREPSTLRDYARLSLAGAFFAADLAFWHWSIQYTSVANSTLLANFAPIFVTLGAWALFGERFSRTFLAGGAIALIGAIVLMGESVSLGGSHLFGDFLGLVTALFYGAYILFVGQLRSEFPTSAIMAWSSVSSATLLLPVALLAGESLFPTSLVGWVVLLCLAWISQAGGQSLIASALAHLPAAFSSVSLLLQPVVAALLAWVLLAEPLGPLQALGGVVILFGILLARKGATNAPRATEESR